MSGASRFLPRADGDRVSYLMIDGAQVPFRAGDTVAAAWLAWSTAPLRHTRTGAPRAPYCMMGVCFDCLAEIDGVPNTQTCMTPARHGMVVRRQSGSRPL